MLLLKRGGGGGGVNIVYNLGENYMLYLSGQKRGMSELKCIWPVILTGECPKIISSPADEEILDVDYYLAYRVNKQNDLWLLYRPRYGMYLG